jgi:6-phosphogluconolactonase (cycloisomerase 2 family)
MVRFDWGRGVTRSATVMGLCVTALAFAGCEDDEDNKTVSEPATYFVYVANDPVATISGAVMDAESGTLTELGGSPYNSSSSFGARLHTAPGLEAIIVGRDLTDQVFIKRRDLDTGELSAVAGIPGGLETVNDNDSESKVAIDSSGQYLYATDDGFAEIHAHRIDLDTLHLSNLSGSPFSATSDQDFIVAHPSINFIYASGFGLTSAMGFEVNTSTGALSPALTHDVGFNSAGLWIDPQGEFLLYADGVGSTLYTIHLNQNNGNMSAGGSVNVGNTMYNVAVHPNGERVYVGTDAGLFVYALNRDTGALVIRPNSPHFTQEIGDIAFTPDGAYVLLTDWSVYAVHVYETDSNGDFNETAVDALSVGQSPTSILIVDPTADEAAAE